MWLKLGFKCNLVPRAFPLKVPKPWERGWVQMITVVSLQLSCAISLNGNLRKSSTKVDKFRSWGTVHTTWKKFGNTALWFLRLGLPSTLNRHENGAFQKRSSNRRNLKTPALRFSVDREHLITDFFENNEIANIMRFPWLSFPQAQIQKDQRLLRFQIPPS